MSFAEDRIIFGNPLAPDGTGLSNIPADGRYYSMKIENGMTTVWCDGECVAQEQGYVEIPR